MEKASKAYKAEESAVKARIEAHAKKCASLKNANQAEICNARHSVYAAAAEQQIAEAQARVKAVAKSVKGPLTDRKSVV